MKKILATLTVITGLAVSSYGQGYIFFDGSTSSGLVSINGVVDTGQDVNASLIAVVNGTNNVIATLLLSNTTAAGDITFFGDGHLYDNSGNSYNTGTAAGPTTFIIDAWLSGNVYPGDGVAGGGHTAPFTMTTAAFGSPVPSLDTMPSLNIIVPEPSSLALIGLGSAALMIFRRRK
jgi:hypothetical protein